MLLGGALVVAIREIGKIYKLLILNCVSLVLILGSALLISGAVVYSSITALREKNQTASPTVE